MTDLAQKPRHYGASAQVDEHLDNDLEKLRALVLGPDYEQALYDYLTGDRDAERVAAVLSEATKHCATSDDSFAKALAPVINKAIHESITQNPARITNAISPIMGPAIRKAVAMALRDMVQSLNSMLELSLSPRGIKWRIQAWRADVSYGRYVMSQTMKFTVEQVLLVHHETGILLHSVVSDEKSAKDPELVSSMLTAIQDFVSDSFETAKDSHLDKVQVGDLTLHLISGSFSVLAIAVRGNLSAAALDEIISSYELIQQKYAVEMEDFTGDRDVFLASEDDLKACLLSEEIASSNQKRKPWLAIVALSVMSALFVYRVGWSYLYAQEQDRILEALTMQEGYVLIRHHEQSKQIQVQVLRSPEAISLEALLNKIDARYFELDVRAQEVTFGAIDVRKLDALHLPTSESEPSLVERYWSLAGSVHNTFLNFEENSVVLSESSVANLNTLISDVKEASDIAERLNPGALQIMVLGFSDYRGTEYGRLNISKQRAELVRALLIENGLATDSIVAWGIGHKDVLLEDKKLQRRVSVQLILPSFDNHSSDNQKTLNARESDNL